MIFILLAITALAFVLLGWMQKKHISFSKRVFAGLGLGIAFGLILNILFRNGTISSEVQSGFSDWLVFFGYGYVDLLRMISIPLIMISIIMAIIKLQSGAKMGKMAGLVITILLATAAMAALVGAITSIGFGLNANEIIQNADESSMAQIANQGQRLADRQARVQTLPQTLRSFIPKNPVADMAGMRSSSYFAAAIFAAFLAIAVLGLRRKHPEDAVLFVRGAGMMQKIIMRLVTLVLRLTPYGIFALMTRVSATTSYTAVVSLGKFLLSSYIALLIVFALHLLILALFGFNPATYVRKGWSVLSFAFISRSSAGTLPLTIECQRDRFGVNEGLASMSSTLGTTIGQNGCAGVYPAMLVVMIWNATGQAIDLMSILQLIGVAAISSFGIAGIGGGATFAAIMVISAMGLQEHLALAAVLVAVEPLIDMARTAVNVSDAMVAGLGTSRILGEVDKETYNSSVPTASGAEVEMEL